VTERSTLTTRELAARLGITRQTLATLVAAGTIPPPFIRTTRKHLWSVAQVEAWERGEAA
jgi:excisionase family DNA binding protein